MSPSPSATATAPASPEAPQEAPRCGHQVNTSKGYKPCVKLPGHDQEGTPAYEAQGKGHASRLYSPRKERAEVPKAILASVEDVEGTEQVRYGAGVQPKEPNEQEKQVIALVKEAHQNWINSGKPKAFNDMPRKRFVMADPKHEEDVRGMLDFAGRYTKLSVRKAPIVKLQNGKWALYFAVTDITKHTSKPNGQN